MMRMRSRIKHRNAVTELWNDGHSVSAIGDQCGLTVTRVNALLKSAKAGYNTPEDQAAAEEVKRLRKAGL